MLGDLFTLPMSGGRATRLTRGMGFDAQPRFSPDGEHVVFTSDRDGGENLWILSLDLADTVQLTRGKHERYQGPEWTPDGDYIVATKGTKLHLWHRTGGSGTELVTEPANLRTIGAAFGADPRFIWFSGRQSQGSIYNNGLDLYQLHVYDRDTGELATRTDRWGGGFRPDALTGRPVAGLRNAPHRRHRLRIRDLESGDERWLAWPVQRDDQESGANRDVYPGMSFTPDSREVVATYGGRIWRIPVDGSAPTRGPVRGRGRSAARTGRGLRVSHRGRRDVRGEADPQRRSVAGWRTPRVHGAVRALRDGPAGWHPEATRGRPPGRAATPHLVPRRPVDRVRDVDGRRRRARLPRARRTARVRPSGSPPSPRCTASRSGRPMERVLCS
jgi:hypothetical protein